MLPSPEADERQLSERVCAMNMNGFKVEETGGGCQWLRKGRLAITDDAMLPKSGEPCVLVTLDEAGDYDSLMEPINFPSLEAALAYVASAERIYGSR